MKEIIVKTRKEANVSIESILALIQSAYGIWQENGLEAPFLHYTMDSFKQATRRATIFVAIDTDSGRIIGTHSLFADKKRKCVHGGLLAVAPEYRGCGIATKMLESETERILKAGFHYMIGTTAITATWSVHWHLKNGYRIIGYSRSPKNNHPTYVFRRQLKPASLSNIRYSLYSNSLFCRCRYLLTYLATRLLKDSDGKRKLFKQ